MTTDPSVAVLKSLPKNAPVWAVGIVSTLMATAASFTLMYAFARPEVQQYIDRSATIKTAQQSADNSTIASILKLVENNSAQITDFAAALSRTQEQNLRLTDRVNTIEKELDSTKSDLRLCEEDLRDCKK